MPHYFVDITGERFGKLVAITYMGQETSKAHNRLWKCQCDCGKSITVAYRHLTSRHASSCGCNKLTNGMKNLRLGGWNKLEKGQACFHNLFLRTKRSAKERNYCFTLTEAEFYILTQSNCYYCGCPPSQVSRAKGTNGEYLFNGVDRIDNSLGYISGNTRPCCKTCNFAKGQMTEQEFYKWIQRAATHITAHIAKATRA